MADWDDVRRAQTHRGRVTVAQQVNTRQKQMNDRLAELLDTGQTLSGWYGREPTTGKQFFVFGESPVTDDVFI